MTRMTYSLVADAMLPDSHSGSHNEKIIDAIANLGVDSDGNATRFTLVDICRHINERLQDENHPWHGQREVPEGSIRDLLFKLRHRGVIENHEVKANSVWVVRAGVDGRYAEHFLANGYVAFGDLDLASASDRDEVRRRYEDACPTEGSDHKSHLFHLKVTVSQYVTFLFGIRKDDYVITPERDTERLRYGRIIGPCESAAGDDGCPYRNRRAVAWNAATLERSACSKPLQNTLTYRRSVFRVLKREAFLAAVAASEPDRRRDDLDSGVEEERVDPESGAVEHPFDPAKIKVRTVPALVGQLLSRMEHAEIDLAPDFQRRAGIWNAEKKSRLIESLLLRIPIPVFYVAADADEKWAVVDGVQRLSTIRDYVKGEFPLTRLEYRSEFDGLRHGDLPRAMQRRIDETQFVVNVIEPGTPPEVTFNIFRRINTGGMPLNGQEIRHALNPGPVRNYLKTLAESDEFAFAEATNRSIRSNRMDDRACVLRFLAFHMAPWEEYSGSSLDGHLDAAMKKINAMGQDRRNALAEDFRKAMRAASRIFGDDAFRKRYVRDDDRHQVSMPLFEAWSVQLARCSQERIDRLVERRDEVRKRFMALLNQDPEFEKAISSSTGTPRRIRKRFAAIRDLVQEFF